MMFRTSLFTALIASIPLWYIQTTHAGRDVIELMNSQNVYAVETSNNDITANLILPYGINMKDVFLNQQGIEALDKLNDDYPSGFKSIDKNYTIAVSMVANTSSAPIYLVRYSYLMQQKQSQSQPNTVVVKNEDFFNNYPDFNSKLADENQLFYGYMGGAIATLLVGTSMIGGGAYYSNKQHKDNSQQMPPVPIFIMLIGTVFEVVGICCAIGSSYHGPKYVGPLKDVISNYNSFVASLNPIIVSQAVTLNTDMTTLSQLIAKPVTGNIQNNVYKLDPGQTLIEPVILPAGSGVKYSGLTLQYYNDNPSLLYQVHGALSVGG